MKKYYQITRLKYMERKQKWLNKPVTDAQCILVFFWEMVAIAAVVALIIHLF